MRCAGKKARASRAGPKLGNEQDLQCKFNRRSIFCQATCVACREARRIAVRRDIWQFEQEEGSACESIRLFHAAILPEDFRNRASKGIPRELTPYERVAVLYVADCWRKEVCDIWEGCTLEEKIRARLEALMELLREGGAV